MSWKSKEPQWNHVISAHDFKTGEIRTFYFLTNSDKYLLVKEVEPQQEQRYKCCGDLTGNEESNGCICKCHKQEQNQNKPERQKHRGFQHTYLTNKHELDVILKPKILPEFWEDEYKNQEQKETWEDRFDESLVEMSPLKGRDMHNRPPLYEVTYDKIEEIKDFIRAELKAKDREFCEELKEIQDKVNESEVNDFKAAEIMWNGIKKIKLNHSKE